MPKARASDKDLKLSCREEGRKESEEFTLSFRYSLFFALKSFEERNGSCLPGMLAAPLALILFGTGHL